jgi:hypothetical protein
MRSLLVATFSLFIFSCKSKSGEDVSASTNAATDTANFTSIHWADSIQSLGELNFGETAQIKFHFTNTGNKPLFVIAAEPGCGCTVADYPKQPVAVGEEGVIIAAFDTKKGHPGEFKKGITVTTNTRPNGNSMLFFQGTIKSKEGEEEKIPQPVAPNE